MPASFQLATSSHHPAWINGSRDSSSSLHLVWSSRPASRDHHDFRRPNPIFLQTTPVCPPWAPLVALPSLPHPDCEAPLSVLSPWCSLQNHLLLGAVSICHSYCRCLSLSFRSILLLSDSCQTIALYESSQGWHRGEAEPSAPPLDSWHSALFAERDYGVIVRSVALVRLRFRILSGPQFLRLQNGNAIYSGCYNERSWAEWFVNRRLFIA